MSRVWEAFSKGDKRCQETPQSFSQIEAESIDDYDVFDARISRSCDDYEALKTTLVWLVRDCKLVRLPACIVK